MKRQFIFTFFFLALQYGLRAQNCEIIGPDNACANQLTYFYAFCLDADGYSWQVDGNYQGSGSTFQYTFTTAGTYQITLYYSIGGMFIADPTYKYVTVTNGITAPTIQATPSEICNSGNLTLTVTNPQGGLTYSWYSVPSGYSGSGTQVTFNNVSTNRQYYVTASNGSCQTTSSTSVNVVQTTVTPVLDGQVFYRKRIIRGSTWASDHYWQTTSTGQSTAKNLIGDYTVTEEGNYYIRKRSTSGNCWTTATGPLFVPINVVPPLPVVEQVKSAGYNQIVFTHSDKIHVLNFADLYWVKDNSADPQVEGNFIINNQIINDRVYADGTYYLKAKDRSTGTWGPTLTFTVQFRGDNGMNWIQTQTYADIHKIVADSRTYYDDSGRPLQTQSKSLTDSVIFASQNLTDRYNRPVGSVLPAPILPKYFNYNGGFLLNNQRKEYTYNNFDTPVNKLNPEEVLSDVAGTVGWYYSNNNSIEPNTPSSPFPYSRVDYYDDGLGEVRFKSGPGSTHKMGSGHELFTANFPVSNELDDYLNKRRLAGINDNQTDNTLKYEGLQSVVRDENGNWAISISDKNGKTVMSARPGSSTDYVLQVSNQITASGNAGASNYQPEVYFYLTHDQALNIQQNLSERIVNNTVYGNQLERNTLGVTESEFVASQYIRLLPGFTTLNNGMPEFHARIAPDDVGLFMVENLETGQRLGPNQTFANGSGVWPAGFYKIIISSGELSFSFVQNFTDVSYLFYNNRGNLVASVSPNGYKQWTQGVSYSQIDKTTYVYNYRGQLVEMKEPDAGTTKYIYTRDGKIRFSTNALQATWVHGWFSYTNYDYLGRPIESGAYKVIWDIPQQDKLIFGSAKMKSIIENTNPDGGLSGGEKFDWLKSSYDYPDVNFSTETGLSGYSQQYTHNKVSYTENENSKTWFSYDEFGQVVQVIQKVKGLSQSGQTRVFVQQYEYDILGAVQKMTHEGFLNGQPLAGSKLFHHYEYDKDRRLSKVYTSTTGGDKKLRATYKYYLHGPLERIILGDGVQGIDYTYNINGWLTHVNHPDPARDPGNDGNNGVRSDAFGFALDYYESEMNNLFPSNAQPQYNGNIAAARWRTEKVYGSTSPDYTGMYSYTYDNKSQVSEAAWSTPNHAANTFTTAGNKYKLGNMSYDPNGNILTLGRYNESGSLANNFSYTYEPFTNKLWDVTGYTSSANAYGHGFKYNQIGQLTDQDLLTGADQYIEYDVTGKVRKVFSDASKTQLKVEFIYDDRGFRLAKKNYFTNRHTWYIRDASGNMLSLYEQDIAQGSLVQTEVPLYGAGRIATLYPQEDGSAQYELTDHLGNVRALVRENINIYTATMEDNGLAELSNPRVEELEYFQNLFETEVTDSRFNHTAPTAVIASPNKAAYLRWVNGMAGMQAADKAIGPAIALKVNAHDTIKAEVWTRFERKPSYARNMDMILLSSLMGNTFTAVGGFEGATLSQTTQSMQTGLTTAGFLTDNQNNRPYAYLNYLIFDQNRAFVTGGWQRIPDNAGFDPGQEALPNQHKQVKFDQPIVIPQSANNGYVYVWVSNESENTKVWFDDLKVTHSQIIVTQATDYGVWGDVLREMKAATFTYRHGYQGKFAEKDLETGWNHFELRDYDPIVARWYSVDAYRQFWSSYLAMGNNAVNSVDPDGGYSWAGASWRWALAFTAGLDPGEIYNSGGEYGFNTRSGAFGSTTTFNFSNEGVVGKSLLGINSKVAEGLLYLWNNPGTRYFTGDYLYFSFDASVFPIFGSKTTPIGWVVPLRGDHAFNIYTFHDASAGVGVEASFSANFGKAFILGDVSEVTIDNFTGTRIQGNIGAGSLGAGLTYSAPRKGSNHFGLISGSFSIGGGSKMVLSGNVNFGETWIRGR